MAHIPFGGSLGVFGFLGGEKIHCHTIFLPPKKPKTP
jgi:hypothetical protein